MKKLVLLFILSTMVFSCKQSDWNTVPIGNNFYFENPQPINDSELNSFPNKFQGKYVNSDSLYLNITDNIICSESENKFRFHKNELDSLKQYFDIENDNFISKDNRKIFKLKKTGDSIEFISKNRDTIFILSDFQKAKRVNGHLVLNQKDSIYWKVKWINLNKNILTIKQLFSDEDLKRMDSITYIHSKMIDSTNYIISPKRIEFINFFKLKKFGYDQEYRKISK